MIKNFLSFEKKKFSLSLKLLAFFLFLGQNAFATTLPHETNQLQGIFQHFAPKEEKAQDRVQKREDPPLSFNRQKDFRLPFSKRENPEEQKAALYYKKALDALAEISARLQEWEEDFAEDVETPSSREMMQKEFSTLLTTVETNIEIAIQINPKHPGYYIVQGVKELLLGRVQNAKENFQTSASLNPNFSDPENDLLPGDAELLIEICDAILKKTPHL